MNEESGFGGVCVYWKVFNDVEEYYMVVIEFDRGGFILCGFFFEVDDEVFILKF